MSQNILKDRQVRSNEYYYDINFVRAIAALCVVMVHVTAANYHLNDKYLGGIPLFLNQITRFGTPLFAVISGFLLYNQAIKGRFQLGRFISSRLTKVLIPFIIWSFIYLLLNSYSFSNINDFTSFKLFLYDFMLGKSSYHLYFIAVVIQFYLLFSIIQVFNSSKQLLVLTVIGLYINYIYLTTSFDISTGLLNQFLNERAFLFNWIFYFFFGGLLVHIWGPIVEWIKKNVIYIIGIGIIPLSFMMYEYMSSNEILGSTRVTNLMNVPILFLVFTGVYYWMGRLKKLQNLILSIGNMSMGIYLVHPLVIYFMREEVSWMLERTRWIPLGYMVTLLGSILIVKLIHKLPFGHYVVIIASRRKSKKKK